MLDDLYRWVIPGRRAVKEHEQPGNTDDAEIYDPTAYKAAFRFAGRMVQSVIPPGQSFFDLVTGPFFPGEGDVAKSANELLAGVSKIVLGVFAGSNFTLSAGEMFLDLFGGTGALLGVEHPTEVCKFIAVPLTELAIVEDEYGEVCEWHWTRSYRAAEIARKWKSGKLPKALSEALETSGGRVKKFRVTQSTIRRDDMSGFDTFVFLADHASAEDPFLDEKFSKLSPWFTPRFYRVPGEAFGRGPGLMALATTKTANRITELTLRGAMFAVLGLWMRRNSQAFNPKTAKFVPGAMWTVSSTGGPLGPDIAKLDVPGRMDYGHLILQELREMIRNITLDDSLPPDQVAVRSATEIVERIKRLNADFGGVYARLYNELIVKVVRWVTWVSSNRGLLPKGIEIDDLITKVQVTSPIARYQQAEAVSQIVQWMEIIIATGGKEALAVVAKVELLWGDIGRKLGVEEKYIRSEADQAKIREAIAKMVAANQAQAQGAAEPIAA